jgi:homocysteine S-methyltransferase
MGTMLYAKGLHQQKLRALNVTQPDLVAGAVHRNVRAGAVIVETNVRRQPHQARFLRPGRAPPCHQRKKGAKIARHAAREQATGGHRTAPDPHRAGEDRRRRGGEAFREQAQALVDSGVDLVILETFRDPARRSMRCGAFATFPSPR